MSKDTSDLAVRMKGYERLMQTRFMPGLPICARMDGKAFHSFTRGMDRPFDRQLMDLFDRVTQHLVEWTNACVGYTQSDEISLIFYSADPKSQVFFDGKIMKMVSVLASYVTEDFNEKKPKYLPNRKHTPAYFDCRCWQVPSLEEAVNYLIWREQDATRNSILSAAQSILSHNEMQGLSVKVLQDKLHEHGINWNDYPVRFKRGQYYQRRKLFHKFTAEELEKLPPKHNAHKDPNLVFLRTQVRGIPMPPLARVANRTAVIFDGKDPIRMSVEQEESCTATCEETV